MKYRINVTKKDIREHWNGGAITCPIHEAVTKKIRGLIYVWNNSIEIDGREIKLHGKALKFSMLQEKEYAVCSSDEVKKEALVKLKPFSFVLDVP